MHTIKLGCLSVALFGVLLAPSYASAQSTTTLSGSELAVKIESLMNQIRMLQSQLASLKGEVRTLLATNLDEGITSDDIKKIQEILASDPTIYPRGLITGYYGPLTREAIKRFQERYGLTATGNIDEDTREYFEEFLKERFQNHVPPGLLHAPGIARKIEMRIWERCDNSGRGHAFLCQKLKFKFDDDDADDEDEDELEIEVGIEDGETKVKIHFENGDEEEFVFDTVDHDEIIDMIVDETDLTEDEVEAVIEFDDEEDEDDSDDDDD